MPRKSTKATVGRRGRRTSREQYEAMVDSHRADLGNNAKAAEAGGVSYNTARKAFNDGLGKEMPPIRTLISAEMVAARAELAKVQGGKDKAKADADAATADLAASRAMQARSLRIARNNSILAMSMGGNLIRAGLKLSVRVEQLMSDPSWTPKPSEAVNLMARITGLNRAAVEMANMSEEMERRILGSPDIVVGHVEITPDQAVETLIEGQRTLDRLRRRAARGDLPEGISPKILDVPSVEAPEPA